MSQPLSINQVVPLSYVRGALMPSSGYDVGPPSLDVARDAVNGEPAITVTGSASPDGPYLASPQEAVSPGPIDDLWDKALDNYGLVRPTEVTEIHVFR